MKEQAISKINKIGKIGNVLTIIARIVVCISLVFAIAGTIFFAITPDDFLKMDLNGDANIAVDLSSLGVKFTDTDKKNLENDLKQSNITVASGQIGGDLDVNSYRVNDHGFELRAGGEMASFSLHRAFWACLAACLYITMTIVTLFFIGSLCKAFEHCQSPFEENVIAKMKRLAFSLIPWVILSSISDGLASGVLSNSFSISASIDLGMVLVILVILAITYVFQYGAMLQQESDETL